MECLDRFGDLVSRRSSDLEGVAAISRPQNRVVNRPDLVFQPFPGIRKNSTDDVGRSVVFRDGMPATAIGTTLLVLICSGGKS